MFERYTDRARRVVVLAQEIARERGLPTIPPLALLAGCLREGEGVAAQVLTELGVTERQVLDAVPTGDGDERGHLPFTPETRRVLENALREALQLGHNYIGTEHLLLGLIRDDNEATAYLDGIGHPSHEVRQAVIRVISEGFTPPLLPDLFRTNAVRMRDLRHVDAGGVVGTDLQRAARDALDLCDAVSARLAAVAQSFREEIDAALAALPDEETPPADAAGG